MAPGSGGTINGGTQLVIGADPADGFAVEAGGTQDVLSNGSAADTVVQDGGQEILSPGGADTNSLILNDGAEIVSSGGIAIATTVQNGGYALINAGGSEAGAVVGSGGILVVSSGAALSGALVDSGGLVVFLPGAIEVGLTLASTGGVFSNGALILDNNSVSLLGSTANGIQISAGEVEYLLGSATASNTGINDSGTQLVGSGATVYETSISAGMQYVYSGGTSSDTRVGGGSGDGQLIAFQIVGSGGVANMTSVGQQGEEIISSDGYGISSYVKVQGTEIVLSRGVESGGVVQAGGVLYVSSGGVAEIGIQSGGLEFVSAGGVAFDTTVSNGGSQVIYAGGASSQTMVLNGGMEVLSGGVGYGTTIQNGGLVLVEAGAELVDATVDSGGAIVIVGGVDSGTVVSGGAVFASGVVVEGPGGGEAAYSIVASGINIGYQQTEYVLSGGIAIDNSLRNLNPYIYTGGEQLVFSGGEALSTVIDTGSAVVYSGGLTSGAVIGTGDGSEIIDAGGVAIATDILAGQFEVSSGGVVSGAVLQGGRASFSGNEYDTTIESAGYLDLLGGEMKNLTLIAGGQANLINGVVLGSLLIDQGAIADVYTRSSNDTLSISGQVVDDGILNYYDQNFDFSSGLTVNGTLAVVAGAILDADFISGQGVILNNSKVVVTSPFYGTINMAGNEAGSVLVFEENSSQPVVTNFGIGDSIVLQSGGVFGPGAGVGIDLSYNTVTGVLHVVETSSSTGSVVSDNAITVSGVSGVYLNSADFTYNFSGGSFNIELATGQTLNAGPGNTTFYPGGIASVINGDGGSDVINYVPGDGAVTINEQNQSGPETSVLQIGSSDYGTGIESVSSDAHGDIILGPDEVPGDTIVLSKMLDSGENGVGYGVSLVTFPYDATYSSQQLIAMAETASYSTSTTTLYAGWEGNTITASDGDLVVYGGGGTNTIFAGAGALTINEQSRLPTEQSILDVWWNPQYLNVTSDSAGDVIINNNDADSITITSMLLGASYGIGSLVFNDGVTFSAAQIDATAEPQGITLPTTFPSLIKGLVATSLTTDAASIRPFIGIYIQDPNGESGSPEQVTITPSNTENGTLYDPWEYYDGGISLNGAITFSSRNYVQYYISHLVFIPTAHEVSPGQTVATTFTITDQNSASTIVSTATTTVIVTAANDAPTITGTEAGLATTDVAALQPFAAVAVTDPDFGVTDSVTITLTDDNGLATDADGSLSGVGLTEVGVGTYTLAADTPANLTAELEALTFTPTVQQVAAGGTVVTNMEIAVTQDGLTTTDTTTSVIVTATAGAPDEAPVITGTASRQVTTDEASLAPFFGTSITNGIASAADTLTITVTNGDGVPTDADGVLTGAGLTEISAGLYTLAAATPASLTAELDSLTFTPAAHQVAPGQTVATGFTLSVTQSGLTTADTTTSVIATAVNDAPVILGTQAGQATTDEVDFSPLASVTISDPDNGVTDGATITLTGTNGLATDADGTLSGMGLTQIDVGLYTLAAASPGSLTAELDALTFTPTVYQVAPGGTVVTSIDLAVTQNGLTTTDATTSVIVMAAAMANQAPVITGTAAGQVTTDEGSLAPFSGTSITDVNAGGTATATIAVTNSNGAPTDADGVLAGVGLTQISTGLYTLAAATPASLSAELDALTFTPVAHQVVPGQTVTTGFTLSVTQGGLTTTDTTTSVTATAVNDAPVITGTQASQATSDEAGLSPLASVTISDPDTGVTDRAMITLTGTNGLATDLDGTLSGTDLTKIGIGLYTLAAATPGSLTAELDALTFTSTAHQVAPGQTVATGITLAVSQNGTTTVNTLASVIATAVNDAPVITGTKAGQLTSDETSLKALASVSISDPDTGVTDSATITLTGTNGLATDLDGTLSGTGLTKIGTSLYTLAAATPGSLTAELDALTFTPTAHQVAPGQTVATGITLAVSQNGATTMNTLASVIATAANDAPIITGTKAGQATSDEASLKALAGVTISDPDNGVADSTTITLTGTNGLATDADGTLSGIGLTKIGAGLYTLAGAAPGSLTAELDALTFTPTAHQVAPGQTVSTGITLAVSQNGLTTIDTLTSVVATAANDAPTITGTKAGQATSDETSLKALAGVTISDPDTGVADSATIALTGTNGLATDADGTLSGTGLTKIGTGLYTLAAAAPGSLTAELDALSFIPTGHQVAPGQTVTTGITLAVGQNGTTTENTLASVIATAANDAPTITGTKASQLTSDETSLKALAGVSISDPDTGVTDSATITLTGTNGLATDLDGTLSGTGLTKIGTGLYTLAAATPGSLTAELDALTFTPTAHQVAPGQTVATGITLAVSQNGATTVNTLASVIATAVNDAPTITGTEAGQATSDETSLKALASVTISDPDTGVTDSATITLTGTNGLATDADGTLAGTGLTKIGTGLYTLAAATLGSLTAQLDALTFTPTVHQVAPGQTVTTGITLAVSQNGATTVNTLTSVIATAVNDAPTITGTTAGQATSDEVSLKALAGVIISDPDTGVTDSVKITLTGTNGLATDADGTLSGTGLTKIGTGLYTLAAATPGSLTAELNALTFRPTAHQVAPGQTVTTGVTLAVSQNGATTVNTLTSVIATAVNDTPSISGTKAGQTVTDVTTLAPLSSVSITDPDVGVTETVTLLVTTGGVTATDANGTLSGAGLTKTGVGTYVLSGTPSLVSAELDALIFTPTPHEVPAGQTVTTGIIIVDDQNGAYVGDGITTIIATAVNTAPVITGLAATQTTTDEASTKPFAPISITGTGTDTATITLTGTSGLATDADGTLSGAGLTKTGTGTYTLAAATASSLTSELAALSFAPTAHQVAPGQTVTTGITLALSQGGATTIASTRLIATAVNDAPSIFGAKATQTITDQTAAKPFANVTISDPDTGVTDTVAITLTGTNGLATDLDGTLSGTGLTKTGIGLYTLAAASPASLTAELDALTFTPTARQVPYGQSAVTGFDLAVTQNGLTTANTTTSVIAIDEEAPTTISNGTLIALQSGLTLNTGGTIHAIAGGTFANTIDYNIGYGALTISEATPGTAESSILAFGSGITESEILLRTDSAGDLILTVGSAANQITLTGMAKSSSSGVGEVSFTDGTTWTAAELVELAALQSSTGEADYSLSTTTGQKTITGTGIFVLPAGITSSQVAVQSNNITGNLTVTLLGANGQPTANSITIDNYWYNGQTRATLLFANGTTLSLNNQAVQTYIGTATQTTLVGSNFAPNLFAPGPGGDQITLGGVYQGGNGQNTIEFGYGNGAVTVNPNEASGSIVFGAGITASDVIFESNNTTGNLTILLLNANGQPTGDSMTINQYWWTGTGVNVASFANGTTLAINHQLTNTWDGTATNKTLIGSDFTPNVFNPGPGGDQITLGANYDGGNGQNTINFGTGDGIITVTGNQGLADVDLSGTLSLTDVTLSTDASNDILLTLADGTDKLIFSGAKYDDSFEGLTFANGTTLTEAEILTTAETGTTGNDTINAAAGSEVIDGRGGNDVVNGGGGYDTYIYREGYGNLTINDAAAGGAKPDGELDFGPGFTSQDLWFTRSGNNLDIDILGSKSQVIVDNWFTNAGAQLAEIKAYNGAEIDTGLNQLIAAMATYDTANPAFNPETATQMPTNTALEAALATAWHG